MTDEMQYFGTFLRAAHVSQKAPTKAHARLIPNHFRIHQYSTLFVVTKPRSFRCLLNPPPPPAPLSVQCLYSRQAAITSVGACASGPMQLEAFIHPFASTTSPPPSIAQLRQRCTAFPPFRIRNFKVSATPEGSGEGIAFEDWALTTGLSSAIGARRQAVSVLVSWKPSCFPRHGDGPGLV